MSRDHGRKFCFSSTFSFLSVTIFLALSLGSTQLAAAIPDTDADAVPDILDNCPTVPNPDQLDTDGDGAGDECEILYGHDPFVSRYPATTSPTPFDSGAEHACIVDDKGLHCWGNNGQGQLDVPALSNPIAVSAGYDHTCALDDNGLTCWGLGMDGVGLPSLVNPRRLSAGIFHTCAIDDDFGVSCWGAVENSGELTVPLGLKNPTQVSAGYEFSCALDDYGVTCWGRNDLYQLEIPPAPILVNPTYLASGPNHSCAIGDGGLVCWGDYSATEQPSLANPTQVAPGLMHTCALDDNGVHCWGDNSFHQTDVPATLQNPVQITAGDNYTCALDDNGVVCWGDNNFGQLNVPALSLTGMVADDFDADGLTDSEEFSLGTHWLMPDSDADGMTDGWEFSHFGDNTRDGTGDNDFDLLTDFDEFNFGTDPDNPDTDFDGLSDFDESNVTFTDPLSADNDGDGMDDNWEVMFFGDTLRDGSADFDADGLPDLQEYNFKSNPTLPDTEFDGLSDLDEFNYGTDPNNSDSDFDGLTDAEEIFNNGTNPLSADNDWDGMDDGWEVIFFGDTLRDGTADFDLDGLTDLQEFSIKADPTLSDTDGDGLSDLDEYNLGTNAGFEETDFDGLTDFDEVNIYGTDPLKADTDGDGVTDFDEINATFTDPLNPDNDGDGMDDNWEITYFGDTSQDGTWDSDGDGLTDLQEFNFGSYPVLFDSDFDGLNDFEETAIYGTDPLKADTDGDGVSDFEEIFVYGTDPLSGTTGSDSDGDGMDDAWEIMYFGDLSRDGSADGDFDSLSDFDEYNLGTNPTLPDTDSDGLLDGDEVNFIGTDPLNSDTDGDGLTDGDEFPIYATDPLLPDSDGDGLNDGVEVYQTGTSPNSADSDGNAIFDYDEDSDGDGVTNGIEVDVNNTNPGVYDNSLPLIDEVLSAEAMRKLNASDGASSDYFGQAVSLDGDLALIGASLDDDHGTDSGSAYIYRLQGDGSWLQEAKLTATDAAAGDRFGDAVSLSGDAALIGAYNDDDKGSGSGSAYLFRRQGDGSWLQEAKLTAADGSAGDTFGISVALNGDLALVGAPYDDDSANESGSAYLFRYQGDGSWLHEAKLTAGDGASGDYLGFVVVLDGEVALLSANKGNTLGYMFRRQADGSWAQESKLTATDATIRNFWGHSVSLSGDVAMAGAVWWDGGVVDGAAYLFRRQGDGSWVQEAKLVSADLVPNDYFGTAVALDGNVALVGAYEDDDLGDSSGSVYLYRRQGDGSWLQEGKLNASDGTAGDRFGHAVSMSAGNVLVGADLDDDNGVNSGSAYIFSLTHNPSVIENTTNVMTTTASDADGEALSYAITSGADQALFSVDASGVVNFVTAPDYEAPSDSNADNLYEVSVTVSDVRGGANTLYLRVTVTDVFEDADGDGLTDTDEVNLYHTDPFNPDTDGDGVNDGDEVNVFFTDPNNGVAPVGVADSYKIDLAQSHTIVAPGVLANDSDGDANPLQAMLETGPAHAASFSLNADGSFDYTHDGSASGDDSFSYKVFDGERYSAVTTVTLRLHTLSEVDKEVSIQPSNYLFGDEPINDCANSTPVLFTVRNNGASDRTLGSLNFDGPDAGQFAFAADNCSGQTLGAGSECTLEVKFCPTSTGSRSAELHVASDDLETPILVAGLFNHESETEEARRRMPPVLNGFRILDGVTEVTGTLKAGVTYTIEWSQLGYHGNYQSAVALFDCSAVAMGTCGDSYGQRFFGPGLVNADSSQLGSWVYGTQTSTQYNYSVSFTPATDRFSSVKDVVLRFYHLSDDDAAAGNRGLSLALPGNIAGQYYDSTGRRIVRQVGP